MASSDEDLALAFHAGDRSAFDALFERYRDPIWAFFRRRTAAPADAEELTQETFLAVLQAARRYEPRASFRSYLFGIAFNVLSASRRKAQRRGDVSAPDWTAWPAPRPIRQRCCGSVRRWPRSIPRIERS